MYILSSFDKEVLKKIRVLYEASFPKEEKKPFPVMLEKLRAKQMIFYAIFNEKDEFSGFMLTAKHGNVLLLDYFAIEPEMRGLGIGSYALAKLCEMHADKSVVIEIEDERVPCADTVQRIRRKNFYIKCGMKIMPYEISLFGVKMRVLTNGNEVPFDEYHAVYRCVFGEGVAKNIFLI